MRLLPSGESPSAKPAAAGVAPRSPAVRETGHVGPSKPRLLDRVRQALIRLEVIQDLRANAEKLLAPSMAAVVTRTEQPLLQAVFDLKSPQMVFGRVALLGDAAFVARPHVAAEVTKAALDAQSLVDALDGSAGDLDSGLARYDQRTAGIRLPPRRPRPAAPEITWRLTVSSPSQAAGRPGTWRRRPTCGSMARTTSSPNAIASWWTACSHRDA